MAVARSEAFASRDRSAADRDDTIDIFLSYAREDQRAAVRLSQLLEAAGWTVWWDRRISTGKTWRFEIDKALQDARCVIVLWSQNSIHSQWVHEEAEEARQAGKLMPVLIERVRPPPGFREVQTADLSGWNESPSAPAFKQLSLDIDAVLNTLPRDSAEAAKAQVFEATDAKARPKSGRRKIAVVLLAAIIILAVGAVLISLSRDWRVAVERIAPNLPVVPGEPAEPDGTISEPPPTSADLPPEKAMPLVAPAEPDSAAPEPPPTSVDLPPEKAMPPVAPAEPDRTVSEPPSASVDVPPANLSKSDNKQAAPSGPSLKQSERASGVGVRCGEVLHRLQLGELLSDEDRTYLQRECGR